jgi:hypothetical protein
VIEATREQEDKIIAMAVAIVLDKLPSEALPQAKVLIERAMHMLDLQVFADDDRWLAQIRQNLLGRDETPENARAKATAVRRIKDKQRQRLQTMFVEVNRLIRTQLQKK